MNAEHYQAELGLSDAEALTLEAHFVHHFGLIYQWAPLWLDEDWDGVMAVVDSFARATLDMNPGVRGKGGSNGQR